MALFASLLALGHQAQAQTATNLISNGSLEDVTFSSNSIEVPNVLQYTEIGIAERQISEIPGWLRTVTYGFASSETGTEYRMDGMFLKRNEDTTTVDTLTGNQFKFYADLYQTINGLTPGETYRFSGDAMVDGDMGTSTFTLSAYTLSEFDGAQNFNMAMPSKIGEALIIGTQLTEPVTSANWRTASFDFIAPADGNVTIRVEKRPVGLLGGPGGSVDPGATGGIGGLCYWDNVSLTSIPEPSSALLSLLALVPVIGRRRR